MKNYRKKIPLVIRNAIKGINEKNRQNILIFLLEKGEKSFMEISRALEIQKSNLSHHLKILTRYGLVYNFYKENEYDEKYSYYSISKLGKKFMANLLNMVIQDKSEAETITLTEDKERIEDPTLIEGELGAHFRTIREHSNTSTTAVFGDQLNDSDSEIITVS
jgi:DNA-binding transcriptional ArsR family regulator